MFIFIAVQMVSALARDSKIPVFHFQLWPCLRPSATIIVSETLSLIGRLGGLLGYHLYNSPSGWENRHCKYSTLSWTIYFCISLPKTGGSWSPCDPSCLQDSHMLKWYKDPLYHGGDNPIFSWSQIIPLYANAMGHLYLLIVLSLIPTIC